MMLAAADTVSEKSNSTIHPLTPTVVTHMGTAVKQPVPNSHL